MRISGRCQRLEIILAVKRFTGSRNADEGDALRRRQAIGLGILVKGGFAHAEPRLQGLEAADIIDGLVGGEELKRAGTADNLALFLGDQIDVGGVEHAPRDERLGKDPARLCFREAQVRD